MALAILLVVALAGGALASHLVRMSPFAVAAPAQVQPPSDASAVSLWLPALNLLGPDDICDSWVSVANLGDEAAQAVLVTMGCRIGSEGCTPGAWTECTGVIAPGAAWSLFGAQIPVGSSSGAILSASAEPLRAIDPDAATDDTVGSWLCARVAEAVAAGGDDAFVALTAAWREGGTVYGLPYEGLAGMPLAATVHRSCPGMMTPGLRTTSNYSALTAADLGAPMEGEWQMIAPAVHAVGLGPESTVYMQNAGAAPAEATIDLVQDGAVVGTCAVEAIAPGHARAVELLGCAPSGFSGMARVRAEQPMAVVVDTEEGDALLTYAASPSIDGGSSSAPMPSHALGRASLNRTRASAGHVQGGPDLETVVHLVRIAGQSEPEATWSVVLRDASGAIVAAQDVALAPGEGGAAVFPAGTLGGTGSLEVVPAAQAIGDIIAVAEQRQRVGGAIAQAHALPLTYAAAPTEQAALVVPLAGADLQNSGLGGELSVTNLVDAEGTIEVVVGFNDGNGIVDIGCAQLGPHQTATFDLVATPGLLFEGFRGTALISATHWTHDGPPALVAAATVRTGGPFAEQVPGDELAYVAPVRVVSAAGALAELARAPEPCDPEVGPLRPAAAPRLPGGMTPQVSRYAGAVLALPLLDNLGQDDLCAARLSVRNAGDEPSRVVLVTFPTPGFCPPNAAGPLALTCVGTVPAGGTLEVPTRANVDSDAAFSGLALSVSTKRLSELGIVLPGVEGDPPVADVLCDRLAALAGDGLGFDAFRAALAQRGRWQGMPLDLVLGPPLRIDVARDCDLNLVAPGPLEPADRYDAPSVVAAAAPFPDEGPFAYAVPVAYMDVPTPGNPAATTRTWLSIQNVGDRCANLEFWLRAHGECAAVVGCNVATLAPNETYVLDVTECLWTALDWTGSVVLRSSMPLAVVAEQVTVESGAMTMRAVPVRTGFDPFDVDLDGQVTAADEARVAAAIGRTATDPAWDDRDDLDGDGTVTDADRALVAMHRCDGSVVPTPTAVVDPTATADPTETGEPATPTATPTMPVDETPTPTGTSPIDATPTPTVAPSRPFRIYLPFVRR